MSSKFSVSEDVEDFIKVIIKKNNLQEISKINYETGSEIGDGYASKTIAVDIINEKEPFHLFLKCPLNCKSTEEMPTERFYTSEVYFYDVVYPAFLKILEERGIEDGFRHAPKCYGTSTKNIIALENLKVKGFVLFDRSQTMNDSHLTLTLRTFAKFHAVSFAYKDQKREEYDKLAAGTFDFYSHTSDIPIFQKFFGDLVNRVLEKFDPVEDKHILEKCDGLPSRLCEMFKSVNKTLNEYSVLTQGDCWCNNMMFLYEEQDDKCPIDIMLFDWQVLRPASLVCDISYFFYTIASKEALDNLEYYLKVYYVELSKQIRQLGSDPEKLYPFEIFETEWKQNCKFGFGMSFNLIKIMLSEKEEVPNMEEVDFDDVEQLENFNRKLKREDEYMDRMKALVRHMVNNDYL